MVLLRFPLVVLFLFVSTAAFAQTTGSLAGKVTDTTGAALPGVTIEAKSPSVQGTRSTVTDVTGAYRLSILPPGEYTVDYRLEGFSPMARRNITVSLGKDTTVDITLRPAAISEQMTVSADAPVIDNTSTTLGTNLTTRAIETLPTGRNYASIVQVTPGVSSDANPTNGAQNTISVYGSSGAENAFYIDGVNTTNMEYGFQGKELNFEFIRS